MKEDKLAELRKKFLEELKNKPKVEPKWPYELFGIECGEGWKGLYQPIIDYIDKYNEDHEEKIEIHQIKEKFGGLRFYTNFKTDTLRAIIEDAEERSYNVCETCGKHIDRPITENHWIYAECEECHQKWLDKRAKAVEAYENKMEEYKAKSENNKNQPQEGERPNIQLTVRRVESSVWWSMGFSKCHYLTADMNRSCKCLLFEWNGVPVGFVGILNTPRRGIPYGCSISRIVILSDYQGLGLSTIIFNFVGGIVKSLSDNEHEYKLYIKTAHRKFGEALGRNPNVRPTMFDGKGRDKKAIEHDNHRYRNRLQRVSYCKEYIGDEIDGYQDILRPIGELRKTKARD